MPPPPSEFDREMRALENEIKRLEAEYNMFFAGRLPRLPWERKSRVETMVRSFDRKEARNTADRFRFQTLQARFVKFLELWDRQLRDREEGGRSKARRGPAAAAPPVVQPAAVEPVTDEPPAPKRSPRKAPAPAATEPPAPATERAATPAERELHVMSLRTRDTDSGQVKELYERLAEAKRAVGETPLAFDRIAALVNAQLQKHASRDEDVAFRIAVKDGKVSLSVKPASD
jgi:hypothetical protein